MEFLKQTAAQLDFGVFDRGNGVFEFEGKNAATKNAVVNWGLAAVVWLVLGKIVSGFSASSPARRVSYLRTSGPTGTGGSRT